MAFGFKAVNEDRVIQIDDSYPVLQFGETGNATPGVNIYFSRPYTSIEQPWLFMRGGNGGYLMGVKFIGGPGLWKGFRFHACASATHDHGLAGRSYGSWKFMVGEWKVSYSGEKYGMRIWDSEGALIYDAGARFISMKYQFQRWLYRSRRTDKYGRSHYYHALTLPSSASLANTENYILVNPMARERFNAVGEVTVSQRKIGPLTGSEVMHITYSDSRSLNITYIQPGIIGRASK